MIDVSTTTIVGCGNIGSTLAFLLALRSRTDSTMKTINLVDNDILEEKNLPYVFRSEVDLNMFIGKPKIYSLWECISDVKSSTLDINAHYSSVENLLSTDLSHNMGTVFDCRDCSHVIPNTTAKLASDGSYCKILLYPKDDDESNIYKVTNYMFGADRYYTLRLCSKLLEMIDYGEITPNVTRLLATDLSLSGGLINAD